jgi:peptidoglycan hydrolase-like protein with peptidoglycan-binding domain
MSKRGKILLIIIGSLTLLIGLILILAKKKQNTTVSSVKRYPGTIAEIDSTVFPLQKGSKGLYVEMLQRWLIFKGKNLVYGADGNFGQETEAALNQQTGKFKFSYVDFSLLYDEIDFMNSIKSE